MAGQRAPLCCSSVNESPPYAAIRCHPRAAPTAKRPACAGGTRSGVAAQLRLAELPPTRHARAHSPSTAPCATLRPGAADVRGAGAAPGGRALSQADAGPDPRCAPTRCNGDTSMPHKGCWCARRADQRPLARLADQHDAAGCATPAGREQGADWGRSQACDGEHVGCPGPPFPSPPGGAHGCVHPARCLAQLQAAAGVLHSGHSDQGARDWACRSWGWNSVCWRSASAC